VPRADDQIVPAAAFEAEVQKLESLFGDLGIEISDGSNLAELSRRAFVELYYATFVSERPKTTHEQNLAEVSVVASLGDVANKINRARKSTEFNTVHAHLKNLIKGAVRMDAPSSVLDNAANKDSQLYVGCLAFGAGMQVELEPVPGGLRRVSGWCVAG
jgi:hypothetical protein